MSSSPTADPTPASLATPAGSLLSVLASMGDPRDRRGRRYALAPLLAAAVAATLAGASSFLAIAHWLTDQDADTVTALGFHPGRARPDESVFRRVFARLDSDALDAALGVWMWTRTAMIDGRRVIAIDGKVVRGARDAGVAAPHLVAAFEHRLGVVLGQVAVAAKTNEIPTVRTLLKGLHAAGMLAGSVITLDAMHTQTDTAKVITNANADYVFTIKANVPWLHAACKRLPWKHIPAHTARERTRGRATCRTIKVTTLPTWIAFPGAAQIAQLRRTVTTTVNGSKKTTVEVVYLITSTSTDPATLATWTRQHWLIENQVHWIRDVTFREDASRVRTGQAPRVMASLRNTALSLIRLNGTSQITATLRHLGRRTDKIITILTSTNGTLP